jgi:hypothetical protein
VKTGASYVFETKYIYDYAYAYAYAYDHATKSDMTRPHSAAAEIALHHLPLLNGIDQHEQV